MTTQVLDWRPTGRSAVTLQASGVLLTLVGLLGYGVLAAVRYDLAAGFSLDGAELLLGLLGTAVALVVLMAVHEGVHALAMLALGVRPSCGLGVTGRVMPYAYTTAPGIRFERRPYVVVALAPTVLVNALSAALVLWAPWGGWFVLVAALHLGGCIGDWALVGVACRQPRHTRFEDLRDGVRLHRPAVRSSGPPR